MTWFTDSPFERMTVQRPQAKRREQDVPAAISRIRWENEKKSIQQSASQYLAITQETNLSVEDIVP